MNVFQTPGAVSWAELQTADPAAAARFYGALFGWKIEVSDMGTGPYHVVKVGDAAVGGICGFPPDAPKVSTWSSYVTVADCDQAAAKARALGGTVCAGPFDIPKVGRMAVIQDPQGAVFNVIAYAAM